MHPIYRQDRDHGIGMGYGEFTDQFRATCEKHMAEGRAQAFAFIFYDATHDVVRSALNQDRGFQTLNDASGRALTLFYLHDDATEKLTDEFNHRFLKALGVAEQIQPPCIIFFRVHHRTIEDVSTHGIDDHTQEPHMVVEQLRRLIIDNIAERGREGDLSALKDLIPVIKFLAMIGS